MWHRDSPASPRQFPESVLEVGEGSIRPAQFLLPEGESQKDALLDLCHLALLLVDRQFELPAEVGGETGLDALAGPFALDQNHEVVGVPRKAVASPFQRPIQIVKQDVGQQRREGSALRRSQLAGLKRGTNHDTRPQVAADEGQQPLVAYLSGHSGHQDVVIDVVEKFRQVKVNGDAITGLEVGSDLLECAVGGASGPKPVARFGEFRVEDRCHDLSDGLLDDPINNGRDAQRAFATTGLRDSHPSHRLGLIATLAQGLADGRPVLTGIRREVLNAQSVDSRCAAVGFHSTPRLFQVGR